MEALSGSDSEEEAVEGDPAVAEVPRDDSSAVTEAAAEVSRPSRASKRAREMEGRAAEAANKRRSLRQ